MHRYENDKRTGEVSVSIAGQRELYSDTQQGRVQFHAAQPDGDDFGEQRGGKIYRGLSVEKEIEIHPGSRCTFTLVPDGMWVTSPGTIMRQFDRANDLRICEPWVPPDFT